MQKITILTRDHLVQLIHLDREVIDCIAKAFSTLASGQVVMPPILSMHMQDVHGEVDVKTAYVPGLENFAIKVSPGFFNNPKLGLPSTSGLMMQFSSTTGMLNTLLLDNGYLTDIRTAAAGGVATRLLSRQDSKSLCIIGSGTQAELQLRAVCLERQIHQVRIWARNHEKAAKLASKLTQQLGIDIAATDALQQAVTEADIVVTTTPSLQPLIQASWLQPGQHITAMGSDQPTKNELAPECLAKADVYIPDKQSQTSILGELRSAIEAGVVPKDKNFDELGALVSKPSLGRTNDKQISICDLTGTGAQDTAIAQLANSRAAEKGLGVIFNN